MLVVKILMWSRMAAGWISTGVYWGRVRSLFLGGAVCTIGGLWEPVAFGLRWYESGTVPELALSLPVSLAVVLGGVVCAVVDHRKTAARARQFQHEQVSLDFSAIQLPSENVGWQLLRWGDNRAAIFCQRVNAGIDDCRRALREDAVAFQRPQILDEDIALYILSRIRSGVAWNGRKVRLDQDLTGDNLAADSPVSVRKTDYFKGEWTNQIALIRIRRVGLDAMGRNSEDVVFEGRRLWLEGPDFKPALIPMSRSRCSNHIGISTLAITPTGIIPVAQQGNDTRESRLLYAPTGSGSADYDDIRKCGGMVPPMFRDLLVYSMERELSEEANIHPSAILKTFVVGHARLLARGGKPEFFGLTFIKDHPRQFATLRKTEVGFINCYRCFETGVSGLTPDPATWTALPTQLGRLSESYADSANTSLLLKLNIGFAAEFIAARIDAAG